MDDGADRPDISRPLGVPPPASSETTSRVMRANRRRDTGPELRLRKALRDAGIKGYRVDYAKAPGRPDICFVGKRLAVFVHGCFWHRCPLCSPSTPKTNSDFWALKFAKNTERDERKRRELEAAGWTVLIAWECRIREDTAEVVAQVATLLGREPAPPQREDTTS